jgi:hypothetical protein
MSHNTVVVKTLRTFTKMSLSFDTFMIFNSQLNSSTLPMLPVINDIISNNSRHFK